MKNIQMVDLKGQYNKIKQEIDSAVISCIENGIFINGPAVKLFGTALEKYLDVAKVIPCANGTDALQIALMALDFKPGDEIIVPAFTYIASAEVIGLLGLVPVMIDVDPDTFNITAELIEAAITPRTKAIIPVHLFGQGANMESIMIVADKYKLYVIEDTAQAIGATYTWSNGDRKKLGTIGHIGCTSFFPSKNLGCYGDGGAIFTNNPELGVKIQMIANHGQERKYVHKYIGVNSRLDTMQAAILNVKLKYLDDYTAARYIAAGYYDNHLKDIEELGIPLRTVNSSHVFHQYTLKTTRRNELKSFLEANEIPAMIYYPVPLNEQEAFKGISKVVGELAVTKSLCNSVISLPIHTEIGRKEQDYIINTIKKFFK